MVSVTTASAADAFAAAIFEASHSSRSAAATTRVWLGARFAAPPDSSSSGKQAAPPRGGAPPSGNEHGIAVHLILPGYIFS